jgi:hypothetical protein
MKKLIAFTVLTFLFVSTGCKQCGENISLGDFELLPESKADWFPYENIDELTFANLSGEIINLSKLVIMEELMYTSFREICNEGWADYAEEYYRGEWLMYEYSGFVNAIRYKLEMTLFVDYLNNSSTLKLFDMAIFSSMITSSGQNGIGGSVYIIANNRGNTISPTDHHYILPEFAAEIEINGNIYQDVWYFNREGTPSLYVQKYLGIIAFLGYDDEIWVLQNN